MATLAFALGAAALGEAIGASALALAAISAVGTALGSYIDSNYILPAIFPPDDVEGPRLSELRLTFSEEGAPHNLCLGDTIRANCAYIWTSDLIEVKKEGSAGGKGGKGSGGSIFSYEYYLDLALVYAFTNGNAMGAVLEVLANGKPIYRLGETVAVAGTIDSITPATINGQPVWELSMATTELGDFQPGGQAVVTGFANAQNNGTFDIIAATADAGAGTSRLRLRPLPSPSPSPVAESGTGNETVTQTIEPFRPSVVEDVEEYPGSTGQSPSPTIEAFQGAGTVPAWTGYAYIVLKRLFLNEFGATAPQVNVICRPNTTATSGGLLQSIFERAKILTSEGGPITLDTSLCTNAVKGFILQGVVDVVKAVQPVLIAYDLLPQDTSTGLRFFPRMNATIIDVDPNDLSAHQDGNEATERPISVIDGPEVAVPSMVAVKYVDVETNYQSGDQFERIITGGTEEVIINVNLPGLALDGLGSEARAIAKRIGYTGIAQKKQVSFSLPFKYAAVQVNDILRIPATAGQDWYVLIKQVDRGDNFILKFEGVEEDIDTALQVGVHESPQGTSNNFTREIAPVEPVPAEPPWIDNGIDVPIDNPGLIIPVIKQDPDAAWTGAFIWVKPKDSGSSEWDELGPVIHEAFVGTAITTLGGGATGHAFRDDVNTVDILMFNGSLESVTFSQITQDGKNIALIGGEVIAFETATLIDTRTYRLSNLWRGFRFTEGEIGSHAAAENFILLSGPGIGVSFFQVPHTWFGVTHEIKAVAPGQNPNDVTDVVEFTLTDGMLRPTPVVNPSLNNDGSTRLYIRWDYSSRSIAPTFGDGSAPLTAQDERYDVEITNGALTVVKKVIGDNRLIYTAAEWAADGFAASDNLSIEIYQVNISMGGDGRGPGLVDGPLTTTLGA